MRLYCSNNSSIYLEATNNSTRRNNNPTAQTINLDFPASNSSASIICPANSQWVLRVTNTSNTNKTHNFDVYPVNGSTYSNVTLPSANVINVDSIAAYAAAYPGGGAP